MPETNAARSEHARTAARPPGRRSRPAPAGPGRNRRRRPEPQPAIPAHTAGQRIPHRSPRRPPTRAAGAGRPTAPSALITPDGDGSSALTRPDRQGLEHFAEAVRRAGHRDRGAQPPDPRRRGRKASLILPRCGRCATNRRGPIVGDVR
ncbi:hypothetical protein HBB16_03275 [Pseudonocardia sp. MCCB 268]|nr:hypothetical protein [Pseudonocardia cytotoxica]